MSKFDCNGAVLHLFLFKGVILLTNIIVWLTKGGKIGLIVGYARFTHFFCRADKGFKLALSIKYAPPRTIFLRAFAGACIYMTFSFFRLKRCSLWGHPTLIFLQEGTRF